ncbi:hypothetical protein Y032_0619g724 [Ancylostoma ceylanicum]|uniref:Peptidase C1A papain C-terminal domain-containing protein n=1 Tax=Ancylostoma ceylanicum TaxID=53326 RepID=A0A016WKE7_9BILA|nr:hypothetical protein Y032_0619g724 [Ancylostoma ceylanicum]
MDVDHMLSIHVVTTRTRFTMASVRVSLMKPRNAERSVSADIQLHTARTAASAYFVKNDTKAIMREIMRGGPVHGAYDTYQDFRLYKGGVYEHTAGARTGGHSIKIIGWGNQRYPNGTVVPYWLIANSWNRDWGEGGTCMP